MAAHKGYCNSCVCPRSISTCDERVFLWRYRYRWSGAVVHRLLTNQACCAHVHALPHVNGPCRATRMLTDIQQAAVRLRDMCLTWSYGGNSGVDLWLKGNPDDIDRRHDHARVIASRISFSHLVRPRHTCCKFACSNCMPHRKL